MQISKQEILQQVIQYIAANMSIEEIQERLAIWKQAERNLAEIANLLDFVDYKISAPDKEFESRLERF